MNLFTAITPGSLKIRTLFLLLIFPGLSLFVNTSYVSYFGHAKWVLLYMLSGMLLLGVMPITDKFSLPKLSGVQRLCLWCLGALMVQGVLMLGPGNQELHVIDRVLFVMWVLVLGHCLRKPEFLYQFGISMAVAGVLVTTVGYLQFFGMLDFVPSGVASKVPSSTFGNPNYAAESFAFCIVFSLFAYSQSKSRIRFLFEPALGAMMSYSIYLQCRAAILGLAMSLLYILIARRPLSLLGGVRVLLVTLVFFYVPRASHWAADSVTDSLSADRSILNPAYGVQSKGFGSFEERLKIWHDSITSVVNNPGGVGAGNFTFGVVPASVANGNRPDELKLWEHPHNEVFRLLVEDGVLFGLAFAVFFAFAIFNAWRGRKNNRDEFSLLVALVLVLIPNAGSSFPLSLAQEFIIVAFIVALGFRCAGTFTEVRPHRAWFAPVTAACAAVFLFTAYRLDYAHTTFFSQRDNPNALAIACALVPSHWEVCLESAKWDIRLNKYPDAQEKLKRILSVQPYHYPTLKVQGMLARAQGNLLDECQALWAYDAIFSNASSLTVMKDKLCSKDLLRDIGRSTLATLAVPPAAFARY